MEDVSKRKEHLSDSMLSLNTVIGVPASISTSCDGELFISNSLNVDRVESTFNMWRSQSMYINLRSFSNTLE